jgi:hypothetical protein
MINITREQFHAFVNKEKHHPGAITSATLHYLTYFDTYKTTGKKINWNWSAFFISPWWFYRKMYLYGFLAIFLFPLLTLPLSFALGSGGLVVSWLCSIILPALYGDYLYLRHASKKIAKGINTSGVNIWPAVLMVWLTLIGLIGFLAIIKIMHPSAEKLPEVDMAKVLARYGQ